MRALPAIATVLALVNLGGCGGSESEPAAAPTATVTVTETVTASPASDPGPTTGTEPNVGDRALRIGDWREGTGIRTRVIAFRQPNETTEPDYLRGETKAAGATALVRACVRDGTEPAILSGFDFTARDREGAVYEVSGTSWAEWPPLPQYPMEREVRPGDCIQGWVLLSTPADVRLTSVELGGGRGGGEVVAEWRLP